MFWSKRFQSRAPWLLGAALALILTISPVAASSSSRVIYCGTYNTMPCGSEFATACLKAGGIYIPESPAAPGQCIFIEA